MSAMLRHFCRSAGNVARIQRRIKIPHMTRSKTAIATIIACSSNCFVAAETYTSIGISMLLSGNKEWETPPGPGQDRLSPHHIGYCLNYLIFLRKIHLFVYQKKSKTISPNVPSNIRSCGCRPKNPLMTSSFRIEYMDPQSMKRSLCLRIHAFYENLSLICVPVALGMVGIALSPLPDPIGKPAACPRNPSIL